MSSNNVFYRIANPKILQAYDLMTEVMKGVVAARSRVARPPKRRGGPPRAAGEAPEAP